MFQGIQICRPGERIQNIGHKIEEYAHRNGYWVNKEFAGHGIGRDLHMPPLVCHYREENLEDVVMKPGMAFTIEPILMMDKEYKMQLDNDGWTVHTPGLASCQWEHTILITDKGYEILTLRDGEKDPFLDK